MFSSGLAFNENFEDFRRNAAEKSICCEMVGGHVVKSVMTNEEGRKLCFVLGTYLEDYMMRRKKEDLLQFGPADLALDSSNIFQPDLMSFEKEDEKLPKLVVEIMANGNIVYDCLDKAVIYRTYGVKEYWLIDLDGQFVYTYGFRNGFDFKRYSFDQSIRSQSYPGFECCISDLMWEEGGGLKELALYHRFKQEIYPDSWASLVADSSYIPLDASQYTAEAFYEWLAVRKNRTRYKSVIELLLGNITAYELPTFRHQNIRGNLYFAVKSHLRTSGQPFQLCFSPIMVELKKIDLLDSVVSPDLFMIHRDEVIYDNIYRGVPEWVIEIASAATASNDYIDKAELYQYHGVHEYWIVNEWKRQVMVMTYKQAEAGQENVETNIYEFFQSIPVKSLPGLKLVMDEVLKQP